MSQIGVLLLLAGMLVAVVKRPAAGFGLILGLLATEQLLQANFTLFVSNPVLGNFVLASVVVLAAVMRVARGEFDIRAYFNPAQILAIVLYLWISLTVLWCPENIIAIDSMRVGVPYALLMVVLAPALISDLNDLRIGMVSGLVYGTGIALLIVLDPSFEIASARLGASLDAAQRTNPLELGSLGGRLMIIASIGGALIPAWWGLPLRGLALILGAGLAVLSGSRGQTIFGIFFSVVFYPLARRVRSFASFAGTVAGVGVLAFALLFVGRMFVGAENEARWSTESLVYGGSGRVDNAKDLLGAYLSSPGHWMIGLGYRAFWSMPTQTGDPYCHIATLDAIAELGLIGFAIYTSVLAVGTYCCYQIHVVSRDIPVRRATSALLAAFFAYSFVLSNKQGTVWSCYYVYLFAIIANRCLVALRAEQFAAAEADFDLVDDIAVAEAPPRPMPFGTPVSMVMES